MVSTGINATQIRAPALEGSALTLRLLAELDRASKADDSKWLKPYLYFFELRVPSSVAAGGERTFFVPLVLPPESYHLSEPFAIAVTEGTNSGLSIEENGIIVRDLTISGTTGWKPKQIPKGFSAGVPLVPPEGRSFTRISSLRSYPAALALSGQRHFQLLHDRIFRTYSDLKNDVSTAAETELYLHDINKDEHWRVYPKNFSLTQDKGRPLLSVYSLTALVRPASAASTIPKSEDQPVIDILNDPLRMMRSATLTARAALTDIGSVQAGTNFAFRNMASVIADVGFIFNDVEALVDGTQETINLPIDALYASQSALKSMLSAHNALVTLGAAEQVPASFLNSMRRLLDAYDIVLSYPEKFKSSLQASIDSYQKNIVDATVPVEKLAELQGVADAGGPTTMDEIAARGTAPAPGDYLRALGRLGLGSAVPRYTGAFEYRLTAYDTLPSLAARFLDDARRWRFIALLNNLRAPFISDAPLPFTRKVGDKILIPDFSTPPSVRGIGMTLGVPPEASTEDALFGTDWLMERVADNSGTYDRVIDFDHGATDLRQVSGRANLAQGLRTRMQTERGSNMLYTKVGILRAVGLGLTAVDVETMRFRVVEGIQADPRIVAVRGLDVLAGGEDGTTPDAVFIEAEVEPRGFGGSERVAVGEE
jgi:hypothetical protein